jgi:UDP-glucose 4-epimerase
MTHDFALRNPTCRVARLRLGYRLSRTTLLGRYLSQPVIPSFLGYDPRLQFLDEDDAAGAIALAAAGDQEGVFNVASDGVVLLSQAIAIMGAQALPVMLPAGQWMSRLAIRSATGVNLPGHLLDVLLHGSVMDCSRLRSEFGWSPERSSRAVMDGFARGLAVEQVEAPSPPQEYELQVYLQRRRRGERNGTAHRALTAGR